MWMDKEHGKECEYCYPGMMTKKIVMLLIGFVIALVLIKLLWDWIAIDVIPGLVTQGFVAGTISWYTSFKLAIVVTIIGIMKKKHMMMHMMYHKGEREERRRH